LASPNREALIASLTENLEPLPHIYAAWLEGADALNTVDAYSDIDLWLDVEDSLEDSAIKAVCQCLETFGPLELNHEREHPHPKIRQCFLRVGEMSKFCFVDLCIQSHSRTLVFTEHRDTVKVLFDKKSVVRFQTSEELDIPSFTQTLRSEFDIFQLWVEKALAREQFLEAFGAYQTCTLGPLVKVLRLQYIPLKLDHGLKHSYQHLPCDVVCRLEPLYKANSLAHLTQLHRQAQTWFHEEIAKFS